MFSRPQRVQCHLAPRWSCPISFASLPVFRQYLLRCPLLLYAHVALLLLCHLPPSSAGSSTTLAGCPVQACAASWSAAEARDYFPVKVPSSPPDWTVRYFPSYAFVFNNLSASEPESYLLYQCGTPQPGGSELSLDPSLQPLLSATTKFFSVPVQTVGVDSSVGTAATGFLELLGERESLLLFDAAYSSSPCIALLAEEGRILPQPINASDSARVQLLLEGNAAAPYSNSVSIAATADSSVLRRASWLLLLSLFFGKEEAALALYSRMLFDWNRLQSPALRSSPVIAWVSFSSYYGEFSITRSAYRDSLTLAAGGSPYSLLSVTTAFSLEQADEFKQALSGVQVLIDESYFFPSVSSYGAVLSNLGFNSSDLASGRFPFLVNASVWRDDARESWDDEGDDWEESAVAQPDAVLADFLRLVQPWAEEPAALQPPWPLLYFRNVAAGQGFYEVPLLCPDPAAPSLPFYSYWNQTAAQQPSISCPPYLLQPELYGGGLSLAGCPTLSCLSPGQYNASVDYFPVQAASQAGEWSVLYFPTYKLVSNNLSTGLQTYLLYQCGSPLPALASDPGFDAAVNVPIAASVASLVTNSTRFFSVPVQRVALDDSLGSVGLALLELLGVRRAVAYLTPATAASPCINWLSALGEVEPVPYAAGSQYGLDPALTSADLILEGNAGSGLSNAVSLAVTAAADGLQGYDSWLRFLSLFFNREAAAQQLSQQTLSGIAQLSARVAAAVSEQQGGSRPTLAWVSFYAGTWTVESSAFRSALSQAAGCLPIAGLTLSSAAAFKQALLTVDVLIDETYWPQPPLNASAALLALGFDAADLSSGQFRFIANGSVWRDDGRLGADGADDWYETAVAQPDAALADLVRVCCPGVATFLSAASPPFLWFRNLAREEPVTVLPPYTACADPSAPELPLSVLAAAAAAAPSPLLLPYSCPAFLTSPAAFNASRPISLYNLSLSAEAASGSSSSSTASLSLSRSLSSSSSSYSSTAARSVTAAASGAEQQRAQSGAASLLPLLLAALILTRIAVL